ncbi:MAG: oxidoreductase [Oceanospirillaceae bacterium]|uniref:sulfite reductase subunit alpha n=1 Tax=unclassified Thalassolituus TaxID=2624967 RepID=UPI000C36963A|nr:MULTISPECIES: sulfite reductase subunit alpha [unclassified Thalassolituus]MAS23794.1 oxidoreductase [Oceanospirillaceae bacterium]MBS53616.1 oxidoreductase [Oceanospirillaceae bacterium]|tara:strand:+ start:841 stop:2268 length:1428 start_codon:yes stop_codon:yes gene_type:complete
MLTPQPYLIAGALVLAYLIFSLYCYRQPIMRWRQRYNKNNAHTAESATLVAYASESGQARTLAETLAQQISAPCVALNQATSLIDSRRNSKEFPHIKQLLIIASTTGEGEAPDNGRLFLSQLQNADVNGIRFAVLALGDSEYSHFCAFGLRLNQQLMQAGAEPLFDTVTVDDMNTAALNKWQQLLNEHGIADASQTSPKPDPSDNSRTLIFHNRQWINPGSPGGGMYQIELGWHGRIPQWQAGDIAELWVPDEQGNIIKREYTIASIPAENSIRLLVREQHFPDGKPGVGSGWLCHNAKAGDSVEATLRSNPKFHAPDDHAPMILIGNGTGLAGLRAHIKQRELNNTCGEEPSSNWLIFGERSPTHDRPWHTELKRWVYSGELQQLDFAYSRFINHEFDSHETPPAEFSHAGYVQHVLESKAEQLKDWLEKGAYLYICGSRDGMAKGVEDTLKNLLGETTMQQLLLSDRYRRDVY